MREILFRGKRKDNGEWIDGYYVRLNGNHHRIYTGYAEIDCGEYFADWVEIDPGTRGEYTGLCDKNGKRIFEGDVILYRGKAEGIIVYGNRYNKTAFIIEYTQGTAWDYLGNDGLGIIVSEIEVIGNIHDNPELLEVTE